MITPIGPPGPVGGLYPTLPVASRPVAPGQDRPPVAEPVRDATGGVDHNASHRQVQPPPGIDRASREQALRGDRADAADESRTRRFSARRTEGDAAAGRTAEADPYGPPVFEEIRAGRVRPRPSSAFLAQAIGQELDAEVGIAGGAYRSARDVTDLYRQTRDAVDRALFRGLRQAPPQGEGRS